jgi:hypothetical protein
MGKRPAQLESLRRAVRRFGWFRKRWAVLHGLALAVLALPGGLLLWFLLDWAFKLPAWPLLVSFLLVSGLGFVAAVRWLIPPLFRRVRTEREAVVIESLHGQLDNQIIGSLQLGEELVEAAGSPRGHSPEFVTILLDQTAARLSDLKPQSLLDIGRTKRLLLGAGLVATAIALVAIFAQAAIRERGDRLRDAYAVVLDTLFPVELRVFPGDTAIVRGRPVELTVEAAGARRPEISLSRTDVKTNEILAEALSLADGKASFTVDPTIDSFDYQFEYGGRRTQSFRVLVDDLPEISAINFELTPPAYTGQSSRTLTGRLPRVAGLAGTTVLVSFAATTELHPELCFVEWADGSRQTLAISGRFAHFGFTLSQPDRATIHLTGILGSGFEMADPFGFEIAVQQDQPPTVTLATKNRRFTLLEDQAALFAIDWTAEDDFAVAEVNLEYRIDTIDPLLGRTPRDGAVPRRIEPARDLVKGRFAEMFKALDPPLQPGDRITLALIAKDNNVETGPGSGRSPPVEIVVVRPDLSGFIEQQYGFGGATLLGGLQKVKRTTDLLIEAAKTVRTEVSQPVDKQPLKVRATPETSPGGGSDAMADYFNLLSGESR